MLTAGRIAPKGVFFAGLLLAATALCCRTPDRGAAPRAAREEGLTLDAQSRRLAEARAHWAASYRLERAGQRAEALEELARAAELDSDNPSLQSMLAAFHEREGHWTDAAAAWERAAKLQPKNFEFWWRLAHALGRADRLQAAAAALENARRADPLQPRAYGALAETLWKLKQYARALRVLEEGVRVNSENLELWLALGQTASRPIPEHPGKLLSPETARSAFEKARALAVPGSPQARGATIALGMVAAQLGEWDRALNEGLTLTPFPAEITGALLSAAASRSEAERDALVAQINAAIEKSPLQASLHTLLGSLHELRKDDTRAAAAYRESLVINARQLEVFHSLIMLYARQGNRAEMTATVLRAREAFPGEARVPWMAGLARMNLKDYAEAAAAFEEAERMGLLNNERLRGMFRFQYGAALERSGNMEAAVGQFQQAIAIATEEGNKRLLAQASNFLGYIWADTHQRLDEALLLIQRAVDIEPNNAAYRDSLGWVYFRLGRFREAAAELQRAVVLMEKEAAEESRALTAEDAVVYDHAAQAVGKLGRRREAIRYWQRALALDAGNKEVAQRLREAQAAPTAQRSRSP